MVKRRGYLYAVMAGTTPFRSSVRTKRSLKAGRSDCCRSRCASGLGTKAIHRVIPASAEIHARLCLRHQCSWIGLDMDPGLRRGDAVEWRQLGKPKAGFDPISAAQTFGEYLREQPLLCVAQVTCHTA